MQVLRGQDPQSGSPIEIKFENGVIHSVEPGRHEEQGWLSAGFVDLQVNGYAGEDVNADTVEQESFARLTEKLLGLGVTTFLPTLITSSEEKTAAVLHAISAARKRYRFVANAIPYVHLEGPHISATDGPRGAHPAKHVRPPSLDEFKRWQAASDGLVGMITLSPHFAEVEQYIAAVSKAGVHVAIGHTDATPEQLHRAVSAGASLSTHLGNGIGTVIPRHSNVLWPQMAEDRLSATLIADGHHLPGEVFKSLVRVKGVHRSILVSDTVAVAGMAAGKYETPVGGRVELNASGRLSLAGTDLLAGATLPLKDGVARAMKMAEISLGDSVKMATENPGRFAGGRGRVRAGIRADLIRFSMDEVESRIETVILAGRKWK